MAERLERFARALGWMNTRLAPAPLRRCDQWLVTHRPLVWHTRLHWIAWWSLLATVALAGLGAWTQSSCAVAWTAASLSAATATIKYATLVVGVCWAVLQLRRRVGELPFRRCAALAALNAAAVVLLCLPSHSFSLAATYRMAHSISDEQLQRELDFHEMHQFWKCSTSLTQPVVDERWPALETSLRRFGLHADKTLESCPEGAHILAVSDSDGMRAPNLLESRLESISSSKQLWGRADGRYAWERRHEVGRGLFLGLLVAVILGVVSNPPYVWRRRLVRIDLPGLPFASRRRRRMWLARFDHWLLIRRPLLWATRAHLLLVKVLLLGVGIVGLCVLASWPPTLSSVFDITRAVLGWLALIWPFVWLLVRRYEVGEALPGAPRRVLGSFLLALAPGPLMALAGFCEDTGFSGVMRLVLGVSATPLALGICAIRTYRSRLSTFLLSATGLLAMVLLILSAETSAGALVAVVCFAALGATLRSRATPSTRGPRFISLLIVMTPGVLSAATRFFFNFVGHADSWAMTCLLFLPAAVIYFEAVAYLLAALARAERQPQPE